MNDDKIERNIDYEGPFFNRMIDKKKLSRESSYIFHILNSVDSLSELYEENTSDLENQLKKYENDTHRLYSNFKKNDISSKYQINENSDIFSKFYSKLINEHNNYNGLNHRIDPLARYLIDRFEICELVEKLGTDCERNCMEINYAGKNDENINFNFYTTTDYELSPMVDKAHFFETITEKEMLDFINGPKILETRGEISLSFENKDKSISIYSDILNENKLTLNYVYGPPKIVDKKRKIYTLENTTEKLLINDLSDSLIYQKIKMLFDKASD